MSERFRIMHSDRTKDIAWEMIASHAEQALLNHSQTLKRLHDRGGLSPSEAVAVLGNRQWRAMSVGDAEDELQELIKIWEHR